MEQWKRIMTNQRTMSFWPVLLAACMSMAMSGTAMAQSKVVFQVSDNDPAKWNLTLNNVRNVQADLGEDKVIAEVVVYGPGIAMLQSGSPVGQRVAAALGKNVKVVACENTMKAQKLTYDDMLPKIGYVPAGVVELIQRQADGYAYIKP
jgi:intracellular sulfur oxidation DsrE/DsrF family protein